MSENANTLERLVEKNLRLEDKIVLLELENKELRKNAETKKIVSKNFKGRVYITAKEAAEFLACSRGTISKYKKNDELETIATGTRNYKVLLSSAMALHEKKIRLASKKTQAACRSEFNLA